jgi:hypothetical protein
MGPGGTGPPVHPGGLDVIEGLLVLALWVLGWLLLGGALALAAVALVWEALAWVGRHLQKPVRPQLPEEVEEDDDFVIRARDVAVPYAVQKDFPNF